MSTWGKPNVRLGPLKAYLFFFRLFSLVFEIPGPGPSLSLEIGISWETRTGDYIDVLYIVPQDYDKRWKHLIVTGSNPSGSRKKIQSPPETNEQAHLFRQLWLWQWLLVSTNDTCTMVQGQDRTPDSFSIIMTQHIKQKALWALLTSTMMRMTTLIGLASLLNIGPGRQAFRPSKFRSSGLSRHGSRASGTYSMVEIYCNGDHDGIQRQRSGYSRAIYF